MIKVYDGRYPDVKVVRDNESEFNQVTAHKVPDNPNALDIIKRIDQATYKGKGQFETPYGICGVTSLSTGCKTVLNIVLSEDSGKAYSVMECGPNALRELYQLNIGSIYAPTIPTISKCPSTEFVGVNDDGTLSELLDIHGIEEWLTND